MSEFLIVPVEDRCQRCGDGDAQRDGISCLCEAEDAPDYSAMADRVYCPVCGDTPLADEPCLCVFYGYGQLDEHGVLHTAPRLPLIVPNDVDEAVHIQHVVQTGEDGWWCDWHHCDANRCFPPH